MNKAFRFFRKKYEMEPANDGENRVFVLGSDGNVVELDVPDDTKEEPDYDEDH